jgi:isopentenyldiphosphate isomerase
MRPAAQQQATGDPRFDTATSARRDDPPGARPHGPLDDPDEMFDLVDADDRVIGRVRRGDAHRDPALLHRSVQILIFGGDGQLLLQRRSASKDLFPGYWCASASGHVASGEDYATTAAREVEEELGVAPKLVYAGKTLVRSQPETEITAFFLAHCDGPFAFSPTETDGGAFFTREELRSHRRDGSLPLTPAAEAALDELDRLERDGLLARYLDEL